MHFVFEYSSSDAVTRLIFSWESWVLGTALLPSFSLIIVVVIQCCVVFLQLFSCAWGYIAVEMSQWISVQHLHILTCTESTFCLYTHTCTTWGRKKGTTFPLQINLLIRNIIWQILVLLLLVNISINVTNLISGVYTNICTFLCKKCDVGCCVINHGVCRRRSCNKISASK